MASATAEPAAWPPASPSDVLRLTPKKSHLQPSPLRNIHPSPSRARYPSISDSGEDGTGSDSDDEDILRLKLAQIEAKLKLKEKERKRRKAVGGRAAFEGSKTPPQSPRRTRPELQVPGSPSPQKTGRNDEAPPSPSRVLLGIDKGLRARDVSLRRAPGISHSLTTAPPPSKPQFSAVAAAALRNATHLSPTRTTFAKPTRPRAQDDPFASSHGDDATAVPKKTFAEKIAEQRAGIQAKENKVKQVEKARSKAWTLTEDDVELSSHSNTSQESQPRKSSLTTSRAPGITDRKAMEQRSTKENRPPGAVAHPRVPQEVAAPVATTSEQDAASFDTFSCLHLSRRLIPHNTLSRQFNSKQLFTLPDVLKSVVSPDFDPPDTPGDWVVLGIVASKSPARDVAREGAGKYMVFTITDLQWELELLLFGHSFEKYYKVSTGTVVAILNPGIMKPRIKDSGKFSLMLTDSSDTLMEIGTARDLGWCKARKKEGKECGSWVDARHTEFCLFHIEHTVKKQRAGRMEVNTMSKMYSPPRKGGVRPKKSFLRGGGGGRDDGLLQEGPIMDLPQRAGGAGGKVFVTSVSSARLIDSDRNTNDPFSQGGDKGERLRKQLAKIEREREITRGLLAGGGDRAAHNAGFEYLRKGLSDADAKAGREAVAPAQVEQRVFSAANVRSIGFDPTRKPGTGLGRDADAKLVEAFKAQSSQIGAGDVHLSPVKLKRKSSLTPLDNGSVRTRPPPSKRTRQEQDGMGWGQRPTLEQRTKHHAAVVGTARGVQAVSAPAETARDVLAKTVKFAPMPTVEDDDEDDLEIIDWV